MIYTPQNLNLQPRMVWHVDLGDGDTAIEFRWNPKGSMVTVTWIRHVDSGARAATQTITETDVFTMGQESLPTEVEVEEAIAQYLNDNGIEVWPG